MKNIQVIDAAENCVYDIFAATEEEFLLIFPDDQDIAFIDEVCDREDAESLNQAFKNIWSRRIPNIKSKSLLNIKNLIAVQEEGDEYFTYLAHIECVKKTSWIAP